MIHFTPSQVRLLVNGYIVEEAHGIDYEVTDEKTPLYGFRDRNYADMAIGRTLVYGSLYVNFVYKGYLLQAIAQMVVPGIDEKDMMLAVDKMDRNNNQFRSAGLDPRELYRSDEIAELLSGPAERLDVDGFDEVASAVKGSFGWGKKKKGPSELPEDMIKTREDHEDLYDNLARDRVPPKGPRLFPNEALLARPGVLTKPFDMKIAYGPQVDNPMYMETIKGVYFRGQSKIVRASVAGAEDVLLERYQFLAKSIV